MQRETRLEVRLDATPEAVASIRRDFAVFAGRAVVLETDIVDAAGVRNLTPEHAVMSLQDAEELELDVIGSLWCCVNLFADESAARSWTAQRR